MEGLPAECLAHRTGEAGATGPQRQQLAEGLDLLCRPAGPVRLQDRDNGRRIDLQTTHRWDLVVRWSEPPRPMVWLEPWTGPHQALISGDRSLELIEAGS